MIVSLWKRQIDDAALEGLGPHGFQTLSRKPQLPGTGAEVIGVECNEKIHGRLGSAGFPIRHSLADHGGIEQTFDDHFTKLFLADRPTRNFPQILTEGLYNL